MNAQKATKQTGRARSEKQEATILAYAAGRVVLVYDSGRKVDLRLSSIPGTDWEPLVAADAVKQDGMKGLVGEPYKHDDWIPPNTVYWAKPAGKKGPYRLCKTTIGRRVNEDNDNNDCLRYTGPTTAPLPDGELAGAVFDRELSAEEIREMHTGPTADPPPGEEITIQEARDIALKNAEDAERKRAEEIAEDQPTKVALSEEYLKAAKPADGLLNENLEALRDCLVRASFEDAASHAAGILEAISLVNLPDEDLTPRGLKLKHMLTNP